jgi:hypothetical protein
MNLIRRKPWIPVLLFYLGFMGLWVWFAWFAARNSPQVIPDPPARTQR